MTESLVTNNPHENVIRQGVYTSLPNIIDLPWIGPLKLTLSQTLSLFIPKHKKKPLW